MIDRRTDRRNDAFTDARDDRRFARAADIAFEVAAHGDTRFDVELNAVLRDALKDRCFDHPRVDRRLQRFEHVAAGQIDRGRALPLQRNLGALRGDHGQRDVLDVAAGKDVRLQLVDRNLQPRFARPHQVRNDDARRNADEPHADERADRQRNARGDRSNPQSKRKIIEKQPRAQDEGQNDDAKDDAGDGNSARKQLMGSGGIRADEDARPFHPGNAYGGSGRHELTFGENVDPLTVDGGHAGRTQVRRRNARAPEQGTMIGARYVVRTLHARERQAGDERVLRIHARRQREKDYAENDRRRDRLGRDENESKTERQDDRRGQERDEPRKFPPGRDPAHVQLEEDAASRRTNGQRDNELVGEPSVDMGAEKQHERARRRRPGDAVQRLHLDEQAQKADDSNSPLTSGLVAKRASSSPKEYDCVTSGAPASFSWASAAFKSGAVPSATPARTASSVLRVSTIPARLYCGRLAFLSTIAPAICGL